MEMLEKADHAAPPKLQMDPTLRSFRSVYVRFLRRPRALGLLHWFLPEKLSQLETGDIDGLYMASEPVTAGKLGLSHLEGSCWGSCVSSRELADEALSETVE